MILSNMIIIIYHATVRLCLRNSTRKHIRELTCVGPERLALPGPEKKPSGPAHVIFSFSVRNSSFIDNNFSQILNQIKHKNGSMTTYLLAELGRAGKENIWLSTDHAVHRPYAMTSSHIFSRPALALNK